MNHFGSAIVAIAFIVGAGEEPTQPQGKLDIRSVEYKRNKDTPIPGRPSGFLEVTGSFENDTQTPIAWSKSSVQISIFRVEGKKLVPVQSQFYGPPDPVADTLLLEAGKSHKFSIEVSERYNGFEAGKKLYILLTSNGQTVGHEFSK